MGIDVQFLCSDKLIFWAKPWEHGLQKGACPLGDVLSLSLSLSLSISLFLFLSLSCY